MVEAASSHVLGSLAQIKAPRRIIDIRISGDYAIFENGAQKIDCYVGCVVSGPRPVETK